MIYTKGGDGGNGGNGGSGGSCRSGEYLKTLFEDPLSNVNRLNV